LAVIPLRPILIVVAGANGSGKTTLTQNLLQDRWMQGVEYLNPDAIAEQQYGGWNDPRAVLRAARHVQAVREQALRQRRSLAFETVFSAPDKLDYVKRAVAAGYFVRLFFVATATPEINAARVVRRVLEGGHEVPIGKIISRYFGAVSQAITAAPLVDRFYLFDNSVDGQPARRILRASGGRIERQYEAAPNPICLRFEQALRR
jgi:predicted ABC-type ATPase